jgi:hypothetical protein
LSTDMSLAAIVSDRSLSVLIVEASSPANCNASGRVVSERGEQCAAVGGAGARYWHTSVREPARLTDTLPRCRIAASVRHVPCISACEKPRACTQTERRDHITASSEAAQRATTHDHRLRGLLELVLVPHARESGAPGFAKVAVV